MIRTVLVCVALGAMACAPEAESVGRDLAADTDSVTAVLTRLAAAISSRDAVAAAADGVPTDSTIAYISDGMVIRGVDYVPVLQRFYAGVDSLSFEWADSEITFPSPGTAVGVGWAEIRALPPGGDWVDDPAIFSFVLVESEGAWSMVRAHKTSTGR